MTETVSLGVFEVLSVPHKGFLSTIGTKKCDVCELLTGRLADPVAVPLVL